MSIVAWHNDAYPFSSVGPLRPTRSLSREIEPSVYNLNFASASIHGHNPSPSASPPPQGTPFPSSDRLSPRYDDTAYPCSSPGQFLKSHRVFLQNGAAPDKKRWGPLS